MRRQLLALSVHVSSFVRISCNTNWCIVPKVWLQTWCFVFLWAKKSWIATLYSNILFDHGRDCLGVGERTTCDSSRYRATDLRLATCDLARLATAQDIVHALYKLIVHPVNFLFGAMFLLSAGSCTKHICKALAQLWWSCGSFFDCSIVVVDHHTSYEKVAFAKQLFLATFLNTQ